jgi:hypothetical protein
MLQTLAHKTNQQYYSDFIAHSKLAHKNTQYLKDDTLYFSVSVLAADHKPWLER